MKLDNPLHTYLFYNAALGAIVVAIISPFQLAIAANPIPFLIVFALLVLVPLPFYFALISQGRLAKTVRVVTFEVGTYLKVDLFATAGLIVLSLNSYLFLYNLIVNHTYFGNDIFNNVLLLNLCVILILAWVLTRKIPITKPHALLIRCPEGEKIYLYEDGKLRHIPNPLTLLLLGHSLQHVITVTRDEFSSYAIGTPIPDITTAPYAIDQAGSYWVVLEGVRHEIPDVYTLSLVLGGRNLTHEPAPALAPANTKKGKPLRSAFDIGLSGG